MNLTVLITDPAGHWMAVHRTGCPDLRRAARHEDRARPWTENHESLTSAVESLAQDFIAEGSLTVEEAFDAIHFYPCVTLPLEEAT